MAPLTKAERLAIGTAVAGQVRQQAKAPRPVTLVGKDGQPVGVATSTDVATSLLARSKIEFSVQAGERPEWVNCVDCGRPVRVAKMGPVISRCRSGAHKCKCGKPVRVNGCGFGKSCLECSGVAATERLLARPPDVRAEQSRRNARAQWDKLGPEERTQRMRAMAAAKPKEVRSKAAKQGGKAAQAKLTPEQIAERCERMRANVDVEHRKERFRQAINALTPEQRLARVQKAVAGRKAAAAARRASKEPA